MSNSIKARPMKSAARWFLVLLVATLLLLWRRSADVQTSGHRWSWLSLKQVSSENLPLQRPSSFVLQPSFFAPKPSESWSLPKPIVRNFDWTVSRASLYVDSVEKLHYTVNGRSPGPAIQAYPGDTLRIRVVNNLSLANAPKNTYIYSSQIDDVHPEGLENQISLHWHGLSMKGAPQMDGASGVTGCSFGPGQEKVYEFTLQEQDVGTHFWHSHIGLSRVEGLYGILIVHNPQDQQLLQSHATQPVPAYDIEDVAVISDHYHRSGLYHQQWYLSRQSRGYEPVPDNGLINGQNVFDCARLMVKGHTCDSDKGIFSRQHRWGADQVVRLRIINTGAIAEMTFSIDEHTLTIIEADGKLVEPLTVHRLSIAVGQRYSVIVNPPARVQNATAPEQYWMRAEMSQHCFNAPNEALDMMIKGIVTWIPASSSGGRVEQGAQKDIKIGSNGLDLRSRGFQTGKRLWNSLQLLALPTSRPWEPSPEPGNREEPCRDLDPASLQPLLLHPAPALNLAHADPRKRGVRYVVHVKSPKMEKHDLSPMGYISDGERQYTWRGAAQTVLSAVASAADRGDVLLRLTEGDTNGTTQDATARVRALLPNPAHQLAFSPHATESRVVELVVNNLDEAPHPFHLHRHKFWMLEQSDSSETRYGSWVPPSPDAKGSLDGAYDLDRAGQRDTISVMPRGWVVLRWIADDPGVSLFHCHVIWHMMAGMSMAFIERPAMLRGLQVPDACSMGSAGAA